MNFNNQMRFWLRTSISWHGLMIELTSLEKRNVKELMWSQVFDLKKFGGYGGNVEYKSRSVWAFKFLRYLMVLRFLNDPNGLVLDLVFSKVVWSLIIIVCLECYKLLKANVTNFRS